MRRLRRVPGSVAADPRRVKQTSAKQFVNRAGASMTDRTALLRRAPIPAPVPRPSTIRPISQTQPIWECGGLPPLLRAEACFGDCSAPQPVLTKHFSRTLNLLAPELGHI